MPLTSAWFATDLQLQTAAENAPPLRRGANGGGVARLQQALVELGFKLPISVKADGTADGMFGGETDKAVREYQTKKGLTADGIAGRDTLTRMDGELAGTFPGGHMTLAEKKTLAADLEKARQMARRCTLLLVVPMTFPAGPKSAPPKPGTLQEKVSALLMDTFAIDGSDRGQVALVQRRFMSFEGRSRVFEFEKTDRHAPKDQQNKDQQKMGHIAFVEYPGGATDLTNNTIFLTPAYFREKDPGERARTLIHEFIHMFNAGPGHPDDTGNLENGQFDLEFRATMGIRFEHAVSNPYCYEYFAKWSEGGL
jgi:peptidoglycan hydrolase-like protein with peptidoglycan-binding domain